MACEATVVGAAPAPRFDRVRVVDGGLWLHGGPSGEEGGRTRVRLLLPARRILEDEDAKVEVRGRVAEVVAEGHAWRWRLEAEPVPPADEERLALFRASYKYIPFGPFLALGGATAALWGAEVHWFITRGYPEWVRGVFGGG
jgi:hypothetical protein